jgi:hypothetical protein
MKSGHQFGLFLGRRHELARLVSAIRGRQSLLIFGPPDSGKSALVEQALLKVPAEIATQCVRVRVEKTLQALLRQQVIQLFAAGDPVIQTAHRRQEAEFRSVESWVKRQTNGRLRSLLFRALESGRYWLFWDNVSRLGLAHYHFLREVVWMRKTPVYLLARGLGYEYVGQAGRLLWSAEQRLELGPLAPEDARKLLVAATKKAGLERLELDDFHEQVLKASRGLPGAILKMAVMAGQPQYQYGKNVKTKLIYMDYLVQLAARVRI